MKDPNDPTAPKPTEQAANGAMLRRIQRSLDRMNDLVELWLCSQRMDPASRPEGIALLTTKEYEVIRGVCHGDQKTYEVIADELHMHRGTFNGHVAKIFAKLKVGNRTGLAIVCIRWGLNVQVTDGNS